MKRDEEGGGKEEKGRGNRGEGVEESRGLAPVWHDDLGTVTAARVPSRSLPPRSRGVGGGVGLGWGRGRKWTEGPTAPG